ncbi:hypothetical protein QTP88_006945 [Uroleucon formosanum]
MALDISIAYDTVWKKRVLAQLYTWNVNGNLFSFIKNFLNDRKFNVKLYDKISSSYTFENRFLQESVLSVTLFSGEPPLHYRRQSHILKYVTKIKNLTDHITKNIFHNPLPINTLPSRYTVFENFKSISENLDFQTQSLKKIWPSLPPWLWSPKINIQLNKYRKHNTDNQIILSLFAEITSYQYSNYTHIYTDASKNKNGVGFSVITDQENHLLQLPSNISIFSAETHAIYQALSIISSSNTSNHYIIISDSLSALTAISNPCPKNELIQHIQKLISEINNPICLMWVPSHIGIPGNEKADMSAYEATLSPLSIQINSLPSFEYFGIIHRKII